ncbi:unnamed protein product [Rangifer tarandus platyrhynchus]|uniref:Uncharacterized protein n=2 Tax=Rangifer tarandus platyrhynchus TaxID=3082113 RepID=A0ABN8Y720_RANTA|nr:unnamed protein product [Rangifer tarandus platyrhynchus]CAI9695424.1 unnamed protein product [Rangifer tarandus platyrhynchus]
MFFSSLLPNPISPGARLSLSACLARTSELRRSPGSRNLRANRRGRAPTGGRHRDMSRGGPTLVPGLGGAAHLPGPSARAAKASESRVPSPTAPQAAPPHTAR